MTQQNQLDTLPSPVPVLVPCSLLSPLCWLFPLSATFSSSLCYLLSALLPLFCIPAVFSVLPVVVPLSAAVFLILSAVVSSALVSFFPLCISSLSSAPVCVKSAPSSLLWFFSLLIFSLLPFPSICCLPLHLLFFLVSGSLESALCSNLRVHL